MLNHGDETKLEVDQNEIDVTKTARSVEGLLRPSAGGPILPSSQCALAIVSVTWFWRGTGNLVDCHLHPELLLLLELSEGSHWK